MQLHWGNFQFDHLNRGRKVMCSLPINDVEGRVVHAGN